MPTSVERADREVVGSLLRHCGGIPLAIELVAAQLTTMAAGDLADRLDQLLRRGDDPVRGVASSSYALLSEEEAAVFRRFAVLDGSVGLALATRVLAGGPVTGPRVVRILGQLVDLGLLRVDRGDERWRWSQDDELHRYARELLAERRTTRRRRSRGSRPSSARCSPTTRGLHREGTPTGSPTCSPRCARCSLPRSRVGQTGRPRWSWRSGCTATGRRRAWARAGSGSAACSRARASDTRVAALRDVRAGVPGVLGRRQRPGNPAPARAADLLTGVDDQYVARTLVFLAGLLDDTDHPDEAVDTIRRSIVIADAFGPELRMPTLMGLGSLLSERGEPRPPSTPDGRSRSAGPRATPTSYGWRCPPPR